MSDKWVLPLCVGLIIALSICLIVISIFEIKIEIQKKKDYNFVCNEIEKESYDVLKEIKDSESEK